MRSHSLSDGECTDGTAVSGVCTSVSLGESRGGSVGEGEDSGWVGCIGLARREGVVGVAASQRGSCEHARHQLADGERGGSQGSHVQAHDDRADGEKSTSRTSIPGVTGKEEGRRKKDSLSWHDPLTTHLIKGMLTFKSGRVGTVFGGTHSNTELVCGHVAGD